MITIHILLSYHLDHVLYCKMCQYPSLPLLSTYAKRWIYRKIANGLAHTRQNDSGVYSPQSLMQYMSKIFTDGSINRSESLCQYMTILLFIGVQARTCNNYIIIVYVCFWQYTCIHLYICGCITH